MTRVAGWITLVLGTLHSVIALVLAAKHIPGWFTGDLWLPEGGLLEPATTTAMFWLSLGSFGVPLALLGGLILTLDRKGQPVPAFIGWGIALWAGVCGAILEPTPFLVAVIPGVLIIRAARRAEDVQTAGDRR